jgi:PKD repeat protein
MTTDFQVINLAPNAQPITAHFLAPSGVEVYSFTTTLAGGGADYYSVTALPPNFSGTLVVETPVQAAMGIVHLRTPGDGTGNTVFPGAPDETLTRTAFIPIDRCTYLYIHNLIPTTANLQLDVFDLIGGGVGSLLRTIPGHGVIAIRPLRDLPLPLDFRGSGVLRADRPIEVTVRSDCGDGEWSAFVAPGQGNTRLLVPHLPPSLPGQVTTTLSIQNTSLLLAVGMITYSSGLTQSIYALPYGGMIISSPFTSTGGAARISSNTPLVAVVRSLSTMTGDLDTLTYPAFAPPEATSAIALPVLFSGYQGWRTGGRTWVRNVGSESADVTIRYVTVPTGTVLWGRQTIPPGESSQFFMPPMPAERASAILLADQPIVAVTGAYNSDDLQDPYLSYRGTNFTFDCERLVGADFAWDPFSPQIGQPVTLTAWVNGRYWITETVDSAGDVGAYTSLVVDSAGRPHIAYVDATAGALKYAWYDGYSWYSTVVDNSGSVDGYTSLKLDTNGSPHISYYGGGNLNYAHYDGVSWHTEAAVIPGDAGFYNSLALDALDQPCISYYSNGDLAYACKGALIWTSDLVDGPGWLGQYNSLALDPSGRPHISYVKMGTWNELRHAYFDGSSWITETVDGTGDGLLYTSIAVDSAGRPHIAYAGRKNQPDGDDLRYAYFDGTSWVTATVDSAGSVGAHVSLALDGYDRPRLAYYDWTNRNLKYAWFDGTTWHISTVDAAGSVGEYTSIGVDSTGLPHVSYYDALHGTLRHATVGLEPTLPLNFHWAFGDSSTGSGMTTTHSYGLPGRYDVTLLATNCLGFGAVTVTHPLTVTCDAAQILSVTTAISACQVTFTAALSGTAPLAYDWDFGAFGSSRVPTPTTDFGQAGTYPYTLTVSNCGGNVQDTYPGAVTVECTPHCDPVHDAGFVLSPLAPHVGESILFEGFALGTPPLTFTWALGDGSTAIGVPMTHAYLVAGSYTVTLTVENGCGEAAAQHQVTVAPGPLWRIYLPLIVR